MRWMYVYADQTMVWPHLLVESDDCFNRIFILAIFMLVAGHSKRLQVHGHNTVGTEFHSQISNALQRINIKAIVQISVFDRIE